MLLGLAIPLSALGLTLPTLANFRDLGGTPVSGGSATKLRPGLILRSADLQSAETKDLEALKRELPGLRVVDLRGAEDAHNPGVMNLGPELLRDQITHIEVLPKATGTKRLARHVVTDRLRVTAPLVPAYFLRYIPVPALRRLSDRVINSGVRRFLDTIELSDVYWWILMEQGPALAQAIRLVAEQSAAESATLVHCAHGKDRTGVVMALILHICGASKEVIAKDYALSAEYGCSATGQGIMLNAMPQRYRERIGEWKADDWQQFDRWCDAEEGTMLEVFRRVERKYGSVDTYLTKRCGIGEAERAKIRASLTC